MAKANGPGYDKYLTKLVGDGRVRYALRVGSKEKFNIGAASLFTVRARHGRIAGKMPAQLGQ